MKLLTLMASTAPEPFPLFSKEVKNVEKDINMNSLLYAENKILSVPQ